MNVRNNVRQTEPIAPPKATNKYAFNVYSLICFRIRAVYSFSIASALSINSCPLPIMSSTKALSFNDDALIFIFIKAP